MAALFNIGKKWKKPKYPSTNEQINKLWHIQTREYYSAIKSNEVLISIHATTSMNIKTIMLSKRSQTQKATYCMITFIYEMSKEAKPETQKLVVARPGWGAK